MSYRLGENWSIAGTVGRAWRPPNVNELFSQGVHQGTAQYEIGDTSLATERSLNVDATLRYVGPRGQLEISAYDNRIDNFIYLEPRAQIQTVRGAYPAYNYAHTDALMRGFEATTQLYLSSWLSWYVSGSLLRGIDRTTRAPLYDMPADRLITSVRVTGSGERGRWVMAPYLDLGVTLVRQQDHVPPITVYKLPTAGYALTNVEIGASALRVGGVTLEPSLAVRNFFNTRYRDYLSRYRLFVDDPGRDVVLRVTMPFGGAGR
jgi:iron complex outermembrane receptor protein